ncbi:MAG: SDR family oxidoreductase [Deltaproteobacteria bacterium]|nr:MAG: SDR family oxidoreductase [Deltaproteobacteria bacterium]
MDRFNLHEKTAIVTGGSRGIGKAIALGFGDSGAKVVVAARKVHLLEEVVEEIRATGGEALAVKCDLSNDNELHNLIDKTVQRFERIDILVNNAGISPFLAKSEEVTKEMFEQVIQVNLLAPFLLCREAGKIMMKNNWGRIINIASVGGMVGFQRQIAYSATKGALIQMTRVLAIEWSQKYNITVNAIAPAYLATDLTEGVRASKKISENLLQRTPMRRFGETEEIVTAALYLASAYSSYTTGTTLTVDGGWMAY